MEIARLWKTYAVLRTALLNNTSVQIFVEIYSQVSNIQIAITTEVE